MKRVILGVALAMMLPAQSFAFSVLCIEDHSTGYNWRDGKWTPANYNTDQLLITDVSDDPELAGANCIAEDQVVSPWGSVSAKRCFNLAAIGEPRSSSGTSRCTAWYDKDDTDKIDSVSCEGAWEDYTFTPNGEFIMSRTYSAPLSLPTDAENRDSLVLAIGKCSVVAP